MFKLIVFISLLGGTVYFLAESHFSIGLPMLFVTLIFSKLTFGYFWFGLHTFFDSGSDGSSGGFGGSGGDGGGDSGGCGGGD